MKHVRLSLISTVAGTLLLTQNSYAAAFQLYELGAPINGTAGVGQTVITSDASTAYYNPAGMALLPTSQFLLGTQMMLPYTHFSPSSTNTIPGNNGGNAGSLLPGADAYFVYHYSPHFKMGISLTAPYGGSLNYDNHWVGRYFVQQMMFYALDLNPTIAYQLNNWAAIGGGLTIEYANLYQTVAIPIIAPILDGQLTIKANDYAAGFNLGILLTPSPATKWGITYRSQIVHHLSGSANFLNISATPNTSTKMVMPATLMTSIAQRLSDKFTLLGELGWANWSSMVDTVVTIRGFSAYTPQNWRNTYRLGLAGQYQYSPCLLTQAGISYDSSPTNSTNRTPNLPMDRQIRVGVGIAYQMLTAVNLGLSYEYINLGNASINNATSIGRLAGSYSRNVANVVQASLNINL